MKRHYVFSINGDWMYGLAAESRAAAWEHVSAKFPNSWVELERIEDIRSHDTPEQVAALIDGA